MIFSFEQLNNLTYATDYWLPCQINGLTTSLHKSRLTMYIGGSTALAAFNNAAEFNAWRNEPFVIIENRERVLPQISLEFHECDLGKRDLSGYNLSISKFEQVDLSKTSLKDCDLSGTSFADVNLSQTDLSGAELTRCNQFINCNMIQANFKNTQMPALIKEAYTANSPQCFGSHCQITNCEIFSGIFLSLSRRPKKKLNLEERINQLEASLKAIDELGIFAVLAQCLAYENIINVLDPFTVFLDELHKAYPGWVGMPKITELIDGITAELVLEKLI